MAPQDQVNVGRASGVPRVTSFHQVLIILLGSMFLGRGSGADMKDRIEDAIPEGPRRNRAVLVVEQMEDHSAAEVEEFLDWHRSFFELVARETRTEAEVRAKVVELIDAVNRFDEVSVDKVFELREALDESEWDEVFSE